MTREGNHGRFPSTERDAAQAGDRIRTGDRPITNRVLYQLSYAGDSLQPFDLTRG